MSMRTILTSNQLNFALSEQRTLELQRNVSIDLNNYEQSLLTKEQEPTENMNRNQNFSQNQNLIIQTSMSDSLNISNMESIERENIEIEQVQIINNIYFGQNNIIHSNQATNHQQQNILIISGHSRLNRQQFLQAIDYLFEQLNKQKIKPKFRLMMNRVHSKCAICLDKIKRSGTICNLKCKHKFHKNCLQKWAQKKSTCPMCRQKLK